MRNFALVFASSLLLVACGGESTPTASSESGAPIAAHVHGLGVDPASNDLYIATHNGLFNLAPEAGTPERVGDSRQDTMGFTIAGPERFLGSGHPGPGEDGPANLGLIESRDGGVSWKSLSLAGEVDFHVLRYASGTVYGFDAYSSRLLVSQDGVSWQKRPAPPGMIDFAVNPEKPEQLIATTESGIVALNGRDRWAPRSGDPGLLAWPAEDQLTLIDGRGRVHSSSDGGEAFSQVGEIGGQPAALTASSGQELFVALADGTIKHSIDAGANWSTVASL